MQSSCTPLERHTLPARLPIGCRRQCGSEIESRFLSGPADLVAADCLSFGAMAALRLRQFSRRSRERGESAAALARGLILLTKALFCSVTVAGIGSTPNRTRTQEGVRSQRLVAFGWRETFRLAVVYGELNRAVTENVCPTG